MLSVGLPFAFLTKRIRSKRESNARDTRRWGYGAEKLQPRNINASFTNNSNVAIDILIFTFYSDHLAIDVETGIVDSYFL